MRLATFCIPIQGQEEVLRLLGLLGVSHILFGDVVLLHAPDPEWDIIVRLTKRLGLTLQEYPDHIEDDNLYLVIQVGSLFQLKNPHVPVVVNKGRHLAVILKSKQAQEIIAKRECCYRLSPLHGTQVVFKALVPPLPPGTPQAWVQQLVEGISKSNLESKIRRLVNFRTRYSFSANYADASTWAEGELRTLGYKTSFQPVEVGRNSTRNVIADKPGSMPGMRDLILVTAHLDSINEEDLNNAPGADDNASGCAGLLEIARLLNRHNNAHDLRFVLFGGEEEGLYGSKEYVNSRDSGLARTRAVINMDMIGKMNERPSFAVLLESESVALAKRLAQAASTYSQDLTVEWSDKCANSDHVPFISKSIPAALTIEGSGETKDVIIHTAADIPTYLNYDLMRSILRMNLAFVAEAVGLSQPLHSTKPLNQEGVTTMNDSVHPEDSSACKAAAAEDDAQNYQTATVRLLSKDHLPPITVVDGSFVVTTKTTLDPTVANGNPARPNRHPTKHPLKRLMIIDGDGTVLYRDLHAGGCVIDIWLRLPLPAMEPQIRFTTLEQNIEIEVDTPLIQNPLANPTHPTRPHVYAHPANPYNIFIHRIRITKDAQTLFECSDSDHAQGYEVWIWDRELA